MFSRLVGLYRSGGEDVGVVRKRKSRDQPPGDEVAGFNYELSARAFMQLQRGFKYCTDVEYTAELTILNVSFDS